MTPVTSFAIALFLAYVAGSIPVGLLIGRFVHGVDLRKVGSGNIGATNVGRTLGRKWGIICLLCDALKGVAGALMPLVVGLPEGWSRPSMVACGAAAVLGHVFPVWLRFRGGKGVATGAGVAMVLSWHAAAAATVMFAIVFAAKRIVSLSSILAAITYAVIALVLHDPRLRENWPLATFAVAIPALIVFRHRDNIGRLLRGEESAFSSHQAKATRAEDPPSKTKSNPTDRVS